MAVHPTLIRGGLAVVCVAWSLAGQPATAAEPDPATAPIVPFVDQTVPDDASGTLVAMRGHRVVACEAEEPPI